jgi:AraC family transcriptional regulator
MDKIKLYIKNMVCDRCILFIEQELGKLQLQAEQISLGEVILPKRLTPKQQALFSKGIQALGFELIEDSRKKIIEKIKTLLIEQIQQGKINEHFSIGKFLSHHFQKDYNSMARLFSDVESITIEHYFILQKIEKVKEWLAYDELTLSEIAWKLGYSSVSHLSAQFKKVTGLTPSHFKKMGSKRRISLDQV